MAGFAIKSSADAIFKCVFGTTTTACTQAWFFPACCSATHYCGTAAILQPRHVVFFYNYRLLYCSYKLSSFPILLLLRLMVMHKKQDQRNPWFFLVIEGTKPLKRYIMGSRGKILFVKYDFYRSLNIVNMIKSWLLMKNFVLFLNLHLVDVCTYCVKIRMLGINDLPIWLYV